MNCAHRQLINIKCVRQPSAVGLLGIAERLYVYCHFQARRCRCQWHSVHSVASPGFSPRGGGHDKHVHTKAGIHHRNVYIKKCDKLAHLITHKMAWSFQRQASVISIKTVNNIPLPIIGVWERIIYYARRNCQIFLHARAPGGARAPLPIAGGANAECMIENVCRIACATLFCKRVFSYSARSVGLLISAHQGNYIPIMDPDTCFLSCRPIFFSSHITVFRLTKAFRIWLNHISLNARYTHVGLLQLYKENAQLSSVWYLYSFNMYFAVLLVYDSVVNYCHSYGVVTCCRAGFNSVYLLNLVEYLFYNRYCIYNNNLVLLLYISVGCLFLFY